MARTNDEIDASLIRMQDSIARHVRELGARIDSVDSEVRHHFDVLAVKLAERIDSVDGELRADCERLEERGRVKRNKLAILCAKQRQELGDSLTTRVDRLERADLPGA